MLLSLPISVSMSVTHNDNQPAEQLELQEPLHTKQTGIGFLFFKMSEFFSFLVLLNRYDGKPTDLEVSWNTTTIGLIVNWMIFVCVCVAATLAMVVSLPRLCLSTTVIKRTLSASKSTWLVVSLLLNIYTAFVATK